MEQGAMPTMEQMRERLEAAKAGGETNAFYAAVAAVEVEREYEGAYPEHEEANPSNP
jgi:hypothetical protein